MNWLNTNARCWLPISSSTKSINTFVLDESIFSLSLIKAGWQAAWRKRVISANACIAPNELSSILATACWRRFSYKAISSEDSSTFCTISVFCGCSSKTSFLVRRSRKGCSTLFNCFCRCLSPFFSMGRINFSLKCGNVPSKPGLANWNKFQISLRWFCMGVPVNNKRNSPLSCIAALDILVSLFLIVWASSSRMTFHCFLLNNTTSAFNNP